MTVPNHLNTSFRYLDVTVAPADITSLIGRIRTELAAMNYVESPTLTFKSPVDAAGRFFSVVLSAITTTRLGWQVLNQAGTDVMGGGRAFQISGTVDTSIRVYTNPYGVFVESDIPSSTQEHAIAGMLDESPESQTSHAVYVYGNATRTSGGSSDGNYNSAGKLFMLDNLVAAQVDRIIGNTSNVGSQIPMLTGSGARLFRPAEVHAQIGAALNRMGGRIYQAYIGDLAIGFEADLTIPIDDVTTATFRCVSLPTAGSVWRLLLRKA